MTPTTARAPRVLTRMSEKCTQTSDRLTLVLPEPPSANRWWRNVNGRMVTSREARAYKEMAFLLAIKARKLCGWRLEGGNVAIALDWYRSRQAGDLDKRIGVLLDALQGAAFESDSQVVELHARRFDDKANPRVELSISRVA